MGTIMRLSVALLYGSVGLLLVTGSSVLTMAQTPSPPAADVISNPFAQDPAAPAAGKQIFDSTCVACHGAGAVGGERGPNLTTGNFQHGGSDAEIFQTIRSGVAGTGMPAFSALPSDNVWRIVSYLKSLSGQGGPLGNATGNAVNGEALFMGAGGCTSCHEINGRGADYASDLSAEGAKPVAAIKSGVLHQPVGGGRGGGRGPVAPHPVDVTLTNGKVAHGWLRNEDTFFVQLQDTDGRWTTYDKKNIKSMANNGTAQPAAGKLTPAQVDDVVAYLAAQKARNFAVAQTATPKPVLPYARIAKPAAQDWTSYWGNYNGSHFSELAQVTPANVRQLQTRWMGSIPGTNGNSEATPIVVDGVMYVSGPGEIAAFDARTGLQKWAFHRKQDIKNPYQNNANNKGVAVLDGRVFMGTLDDLLIAIDANTGRELWEVRTDNTMEGYQMGGAPLAIDGKIIQGVSGGELGTRDYLDAYDPATGKRLWRTYTIPAPGEPGSETWSGDSWKIGGGPTWLTGSYDPETHTLYWGVGNPGPDYNAETRKGDNLYTDSLLAIDADTGKIKWYYQFTPNDDHDWDSTEAYVLTDMVIDGKPRKVILHADRNGVYYILDRTNGKLLLGKSFVKTNWYKGFDANGRPIVDPDTVATDKGHVVFPATGGTNFQAPSYDAAKGLFILEYVSAQGFAQSAPVTYEKGKLYLGRGAGPAPAPAQPTEQGVEALDAKTGKILWKFPMSRVSLGSGLLATKGGVVFVGAPEGQAIALDEKTGKPLWHTRLNGAVNASPISYSIGGKQYFALVAGNVVYSFSLPE
jgi:alcohol dehydrogenase (cytochrome c)